MHAQPLAAPSLVHSHLVHRILSRLAEAERLELDPWLRDDLRIARLTVIYAATGEALLCSPHVLASYAVLGLHPEKVWPAILARRQALGGSMFEVGAPPIPRKPAQSVKLWSKKTNGARAVNSRADEALVLRGPRLLPMATASIAALFPNPDQSSSAKTRPFTLDEIAQVVDYSGAPGPVCALTISALRARGEWPNEDGPATTVLSVAILGMMLEGVCCRRTVQRRIKRAVELGYWRRVRDANSWTNCPKCGKPRSAGKCSACSYRGRSKDEKGNWTGEFMRVPVYEFDVHKFRSAPRCRELHHFGARTYAEYKQSAKRGELIDMSARKPAQPASPPPKSPAPAAPAPAKQPAAEHAHRNTTRDPQPQPKLTRRECAKFMVNFEQRRRGKTTYFSRADGFSVALRPGEEGYSPPMPASAAFAAECEAWSREKGAVLDALKFWGYKIDPDLTP